jgi:hypothetical protein
MSPYTTGFNNNIIMQHGRAITTETMPPWESTLTKSSSEVVNNNRNIIMPLYQRLLYQEIPHMQKLCDDKTLFDTTAFTGKYLVGIPLHPGQHVFIICPCFTISKRPHNNTSPSILLN